MTCSAEHALLVKKHPLQRWEHAASAGTSILTMGMCVHVVPSGSWHKVTCMQPEEPEEHVPKKDVCR